MYWLYFSGISFHLNTPPFEESLDILAMGILLHTNFQCLRLCSAYMFVFLSLHKGLQVLLSSRCSMDS